ncbi:repair protein Rad1/Rec1/Rad17-domain-containing protein, partial [Bipolaris maydis]
RLTAVSSSARQLYQLLRCIAFSNKAHVQISDIGLKLAVDEASVMEASAFLDKSLFTAYTFNDSDDASEPTPVFQISLPALLETLQIFGLTDPANSKPPWARDAPYPPGSPLAITLTELSIRTNRDSSISDSDTVFRSSYKFSLIQKAARAMSVASKVSIRADTQGVLSLQFMIEVESPAPGPGAGGAGSLAAGKNGFVDFRFVPLVDDDDEEVEADTLTRR